MFIQYEVQGSVAKGLGFGLRLIAFYRSNICIVGFKSHFGLRKQ
jgi:hypothetical protein